MAIYIPGRGYVNSKINQDNVETDGYGTHHMAEDPSLWEPVRTNHFEFQVIGLQDKLNALNDTYYNYDETNRKAEDVIRLSVEGAAAPVYTQSPLSITRGNTTIHYAGRMQFQNTTIKVKDAVGMNVLGALHAWLNLSGNISTEKVGHSSDYKLVCYLREYTPDYIKIREWKLYGCWISGFNESGFDSTNEGLYDITATICYDRGELVRDTVENI